MADIEKTLKLNVDTGDSVQSVKKLRDGVEDLSNEINDVGESSDGLKKFNTQLDNQKKALDKVEQSAKKTNTGISGMVGSIVKGIGIASLATAGFALFTDALMKNQKVADFVSTAMKTIEIILSQVIDVVIGVIENVSKTTNGFDALGKVINGLITLSLTPLKLLFFGLKLAIEEIQLAWEESIFGDGDPETIKKLNESIEGTKNSIIEVGEDALKAGEDVVKNFVPAVMSVGQVVEGVVDGVSKIDAKAAFTRAKNITNLQNTAKLAQEQAKRLAEQYDREAEKLRQLRDNDLNSIEERKKANDELGEVLNKQEQALLQQANAGVQLAQANLSVNKTIENQAALTAALAEQDAVLAKIEGLRSEQQQNKVNLTKEEIQLTQTAKQGEVERANVQRQFTTEQVKNDIQRLEEKRAALDEERTAELKLLEDKRLTFKEGTQARVDADNEYLAKKQELDNKILASDAELALKRTEAANRDATARLEADIIANEFDFEARQQLLDRQREQALANVNLTEGEKFKIIEEFNKKQEDLERSKTDLTIRGLQEVFDVGASLTGALSALSDASFARKSRGLKKGSEEEQKLAKKQFEQNKKIQVAQALISGALGVVNILSAKSVLPSPFDAIAKAIQIGSLAATTAVQIAKIKSTQFESPAGNLDTPGQPGDGGLGNQIGSTNEGPGGISALPTFDLRSQQIGGAGSLLGLNNQGQNGQPVRVFVTETDISNVQGKVQVIQGNSLFGGGGG